MAAAHESNGRVFVSSTCYDLLDLRASLEATLRGAGLSPVLSDRPTSEFTNPGGADSIETCLVNLRTCERCVVVLSQRYGPSLEKLGYGDRSATHLEYDEAMKRGIPVTLYVRDRLLAEYELWRKNPGLKPSWAKGDDSKQLFQFLDAAKKLEESKKPNWLWPFTSSIDLCERVLKDMGSTASTAVIRMLSDQGRLPLFSITPKQYLKSRQLITLKNAGKVPALRLSVRNPEGDVEFDAADFVPTMHEETSFKFTSDMFSRCSGLPVLQICYETPTGERIVDLFVILPAVDGAFRVAPAGRRFVGGSLRLASPEVSMDGGIASIPRRPVNDAYDNRTL